MDSLNELAAYLTYVRATSGVHITISGLTERYIDQPSLAEALLPHLWHLNPYCLFIKKERERWDVCIRAKRVLYAQLQRANGGCVECLCPFGVLEKSWPVLVHGRMVGAVSASMYQAESGKARECVERAAAQYGFDAKGALSTYADALLIRTDARLAAECQLPILARSLSALVMEGQARMSPEAGANHELVARAIEYIIAHAAEPIAVPEICLHLNVSESHLQHLFQRLRRQSMVKTIADVRLRWARELLMEGRLNVRETAHTCGFSDPNYFSTMFARRYGTPPSAYRKQNGGG